MYRYIYLYIIIYILSRACVGACVGARAYVRVDALALSVLPYSASHTELAYFLKFVDECVSDLDAFLNLFV